MATASIDKTTDPGLTSQEARALLLKSGLNSMPDTAMHPVRRALSKFWEPVPWMLEAAVVLEVFLGKYLEAGVILCLLCFNAGLAFFQEGRAQATLAALNKRLSLNATAKRDGAWKTIPAADLVTGDVVKLSLGAIVAADVRLTDGSVLLDQSMLTGESVPSEAGAGFQAYAGALVRRGEANAIVTATGVRTKFGRTAELVRTAHVESTQQKAVLRVVRNLAAFNSVIIAMLVIYAHTLRMPASEIIPLVLTGVLASIPVALPATFTLAAAIGARALAKLGVLPTRLSAVDEAASIDVLCADKTGTLTANELKVTAVQTFADYDEAHVLGLAALASSQAGQDPVDAAIREAAAKSTPGDLPVLIKFLPFDPATKMSEATAHDAAGQSLRTVKGAFTAVASLAAPEPQAMKAGEALEAQGFRVLAVAVGPAKSLKLAGLIALSDPPRPDSAELIKELLALGVRPVMITGDAPATAAAVAHSVGLDGKVCPSGPLPDKVQPQDFAVFAGVLPEGKFNLVKAFQKSGHTVGMCGDGANDAPALRQAHMGIAVSTATDVAKSAAGIVLTTPGLSGIVASIKEGRITFERIQTYTMNSVIKKIVNVLFLSAGLVMTGHAILTPLLMVILMVIGDFLAMSLTTDNVHSSSVPNVWRIGRLTVAGVVIGVCNLLFCVALLAFAKYKLALSLTDLRTVSMIVLVFSGEATLYSIRTRKRIWASRPSAWVIFSTVGDICIVSILATLGFVLSPISVFVVIGTLGVSIVFAFVLDTVKVPLFRRLKIT